MYLDKLIFSVNAVSLKSDVGWSGQSPDLSIRQLFLRSYLEEKMFKHCYRSTGTKRSHPWEVVAIHPHICNGTILSFRNRLQKNIDADGHHLGDIIHYSSNMMNIKWYVLINSNMKSGLLHSYCSSLYNRNSLQKHNPVHESVQLLISTNTKYTWLATT